MYIVDTRNLRLTIIIEDYVGEIINLPHNIVQFLQEFHSSASIIVLDHLVRQPKNGNQTWQRRGVHSLWDQHLGRSIRIGIPGRSWPGRLVLYLISSISMDQKAETLSSQNPAEIHEQLRQLRETRLPGNIR